MGDVTLAAEGASAFVLVGVTGMLCGVLVDVALGAFADEPCGVEIGVEPGWTGRLFNKEARLRNAAFASATFRLWNFSLSNFSAAAISDWCVGFASARDLTIGVSSSNFSCSFSIVRPSS